MKSLMGGLKLRANSKQYEMPKDLMKQIKYVGEKKIKSQKPIVCGQVSIQIENKSHWITGIQQLQIVNC